ncbi:hypothetical protein OR60_08615, partial [Xanthomonas vesicatoria]
MKRSLLLLATLFSAGGALAQTGDVSAEAASARALDLSVPQAPLQYRSDPEYSTDPPGTFYGDKS